MLSFTSLIEAKIKKNLVRTFPEAPGEQAFVNRHKQEDVLKDFRPDDDNDAFTGGNVAVFDRSKNHFGYDMNKSIRQYESEDIREDDKHHHKAGKRHIFINGKWVGTTAYAKNNKDALKRYIAVHPEVHSSKVKIASESVNEGKNFNKLSNTDYKVGELVHAGLAVRGGAGFIGRVKKIDGDHLHLNLGMSKFGDRIVKAHKSVCTKEMNESKFPMITKVLSEISKKLTIESLGRDRQKDFADSKGKMKKSDNIDKKSDKKDKVKEFIDQVRKKK